MRAPFFKRINVILCIVVDVQQTVCVIYCSVLTMNILIRGSPPFLFYLSVIMLNFKMRIIVQEVVRILKLVDYFREIRKHQEIKDELLLRNQSNKSEW